MIIPGHIGGRMVKWLNTILVTPEESDNFYHFHDNRVLPPNVDQERAKNEGAFCAAMCPLHRTTHLQWQQVSRQQPCESDNFHHSTMTMWCCLVWMKG